MLIVYLFIYCFGLWTLLCNVAVWAKLDLQTLQILAPLPLVAGIALALPAGRRASQSSREIPILSEPAKNSAFWPWFIAAAAIVSLRGLQGGHWYGIFWIAAILYLASWLFLMQPNGLASSAQTERAAPKRSILILALLGVISAGLTYAAHRPDADDSFFVGVISDAVAHPHLAVLGHDSIYGDDRFALILPTYAVDSVELLTATLARTFGGNPILWAHAIVPTCFAALLPFALALLMRTVSGRWMMGTILALALLALLGETHHSVGNFAYVRMFQGKSVLVSLGIPLLYACAWRFGASGSIWDWVTLFLCSIAALGLSSSGIFAVPLALGIAGVAAWRPGRSLRTLATLLPAAYPLACGLGLRGSFSAVAGVFNTIHPTDGGMILDDFGRHGQFIVLFGVLAAPLLPRSGVMSRTLAAAALLLFLGPLNPLLLRFFARLITPEVAWRLLWSFPFVSFAAMAMVAIGQAARLKWGRMGIAGAGAAALVGIALLIPHSTLRQSNHVWFSWGPYKLPPRDWDLAQAAAKATPRGESALAPEAIAQWIPLLEDRPTLVSVRSIYDDQMAVRMAVGEGEERRELRELFSGQQFSPDGTERLLDRLAHYRVGLVVTTPEVADRLNAPLIRRGYRRVSEGMDYVFYALTSHFAAQSRPPR